MTENGCEHVNRWLTSFPIYINKFSGIPSQQLIKQTNGRTIATFITCYHIKMHVSFRWLCDIIGCEAMAASPKRNCQKPISYCVTCALYNFVQFSVRLTIATKWSSKVASHSNACQLVIHWIDTFWIGCYQWLIIILLMRRCFAQLHEPMI